MAYLGQVDRKASNIQVFNVASSTSATHNIGWTPPSEQTIIVTINGVKQHTNAYSFSGAVLTLSSALVTTDELEVIGINDIGNSLTPVDGSVTASKLGDDAVTLAKMAALARGKIIVGDSSGDPSALTVGGANTVLTSDGTDASWAAVASSGFHNVQFITVSASPVTLTSGTTLILIELQGAGGSGGGMDAVGYSGGTGGAGSYSLQQLTVVDTDTWNVTIGAGGVTGATINGGDTEFATVSGSSLGSTITAGGGVGSPKASGSHLDGGAGGTVTNANTGNKLSIAGMNGSSGPILKKGPDSRWGFGGVKIAYATGNGGAAVGYGGGGGTADAVFAVGGNGGNGLAIIWEYK